MVATLACGLTVAGCAGTKEKPTVPTGAGGIGGIGGLPAIDGLESLTINPPSANAMLMPSGTGSALRATQQFMATGVINGVSQDVTTRVTWSSNLMGVTFTPGTTSGLANVTSPGIYMISAKSGGITASATLTATYNGDQFDPGFNQTNGNKTALDGTPGGSTQIMYPVDKSLFPANLTPIYAQMMASGANSVARLNFQASGLSVNYYANCTAIDDTNANDPLPGGGCYVKLPLSLTSLFIATSEKEDIKMTARVTNGNTLVESQTINVAWANVGLSGGLYYWSVVSGVTVCPNSISTPGTYCRLDPRRTGELDPLLGTAIYRYDLSTGTPAPTITWTDDGGPKGTSPYSGAPQAIVNGTAGGHCIGCHAISNDGKYMALTLGGSSGMDGANFSLLDIGMQQLISINPSARTDPNSSPTSNPTDYWKQFRHEGLAAESTWGPNNDMLVSMFQSKLYKTAITINGTTGTAIRMGQVIPSWAEYATDPFWSHDGSLFVFTSFPTPSVGLYNMTGLNGDQKKGGAIGIANADATGVMDNARLLVNRGAGVTSFYPSISNDSKMVVFNQSTCGAEIDSNKTSTDYGNHSCDGYDDSSTTLWVVNPMGGPTTRLDAANGPPNSANSWPRWSPDKGTFRGETLYWVAFSSRRPYGMQVNYTMTGAAGKPQLWIAGVRTGEIIVGDPSYGAVWLPTQNTRQASPQGNHVPQWVKFAVVIDG